MCKGIYLHVCLCIIRVNHCVYGGQERLLSPLGVMCSCE